MIIDKADRVAATPVEETDIQGVKMRVLMADHNGAPNYAFRLFDLAPGGHTAHHTHAWEHEVYVLEGKGVIRQEDREYPVERGSFALIPPEEIHQFINRGDDVFRFICVVPLKRD